MAMLMNGEAHRVILISGLQLLFGYEQMGRENGSINEEDEISEGRWELQKQTSGDRKVPAAILGKGKSFS